MKRFFTAAIVALVFASSNVFALTGFLTDQRLNGSLRYCTYSNGVILTISSLSLCPLSID
jgi:hypothetical protein